MPARDIDKVFMEIAMTVSTMSYDEQLKVGSIIVKDGNILSMGYNGNPKGMDNQTRNPMGKTLKTVVHSEGNSLMKLAKNGGSANGATIYSTHSCCYNCALLVAQSGINRVVFENVYDQSAIDFLVEYGIEVTRITS